MKDDLQTIAANIKGIVYALTLLDTYPTSFGNVTPAIQALHCMLDQQISQLLSVVDV